MSITLLFSECIYSALGYRKKHSKACSDSTDLATLWFRLYLSCSNACIADISPLSSLFTASTSIWVLLSLLLLLLLLLLFLLLKVLEQPSYLPPYVLSFPDLMRFMITTARLIFLMSTFDRVLKSSMP